MGIGFNEINKQKSVSRTLDEILRFINLYDAQLNYRKTDYAGLYGQAKDRGYKYISFSEGEISLLPDTRKDIQREFSEFLDKIGTTDTHGQLLLCREYSTLFGDMLSERKAQENSKIRVNLAVSVLCAVGVFITFI